ncbi:MAG: DegT/DnrJ/EryC1/StrS family aminotransferase, partial [Polyangia bacterium]
QLIGPRTKAIVVVHYAGVGCRMDVIAEIARKAGVVLIEDNAHGLFGKQDGRWLGSFGAMATQSFHETKVITCGEGGALLLNDPKLVERAEIIREKGTDRSRFFRGEVDKYTWVDLGSSYLLSDLQAAFLWAQLEQWEDTQRRRRAIWTRYEAALRAWAECLGASLPFIPEDCEQAYHMFYLLMPSLAARQALIAHFKKHQIIAVFHYLPLHRSPMGLRSGGAAAHCPVTDDVSDRIVRLPFYNDLSEGDQQRVIEVALGFTT